MVKEVGFGSLSNHFLQRSRREGADFNLLVVGPAGCGKSTLLSNLYNQEILPADRRRNARIPDSIEFIDHESVIEEAGMTLRLKVTEVLGYGELSFGGAQAQVKKIQKIVKNVEEKHRLFFDGENYAKRPQKNANESKGVKDQLYHAAVIFIQPQRNLNISANDIALLQALQSRVNLIPVIAKADTFIGEELCQIKANLKKAFNNSKILLFPNITDVSDDDWVIKEAVDVRSHCPFLTIASGSENNNSVRARQYPWGSVSIDAPLSRTKATNASAQSLSLAGSSAARLFDAVECCGNDLFPMQKMLIRSHFEFLKRHTLEKLYENFRTEIVCHVPVAPEAPMRLNKSRETLKEPAAAAVESAEKAEVSAIAPVEDNGEEELFQATILDPIREEDEQISVNLNSNDKKGGKKVKKSSSKTLSSSKMSAEKLNESHDDLVSPLPSIQ